MSTNRVNHMGCLEEPAPYVLPVPLIERRGLRPQLLRIVTNKVAFEMMELPSPTKGTSCFHGLKARNFKNAGNMIVWYCTDKTDEHLTCNRHICDSPSCQLLSIAATLTFFNLCCHFIAQKKSPAVNYALWFSLACSSGGSDVIYWFILWEHLPIV